MIPDTLGDKQADMLARNQRKRKKTAGPRKKEEKARPTRLSLDKILLQKLLECKSSRDACYMAHVIQQLREHKSFGTYQEFYKYKEGDGPDGPGFSFPIHEPTPQNQMESIPA